MAETSPPPAKPRGRRRRLQFTVRSLLVLMVLVALGFGLVGRVLRQHRTLKQIEAFSPLLSVQYDYELDAETGKRLPYHEQDCPGPDWLREIVGACMIDDICGKVVTVHMGFLPSRRRAFGTRDFTAIGDSELEQIPALLNRFPRLREVSIAVSTRTTDEGMANVAEIPQLVELNLGMTRVSDKGLRHLRGLHKLRSLELSWTRVVGPGLIHVEQLPELASLYFSENELSEDGLRSIGRLANLRRLYLISTRFDDAGLVHLRNLAKLDELQLHSTGVTDAGVSHLAGLSKLRTLALDHTKITDAGLRHLKELTNLESLDLEGTQVNGLTSLKPR